MGLNGAGGVVLLGSRRREAIYGVSWDKAADPTLTRTDDAEGMTAEVGVDAGVVVNDFDGAQIYRDITEETDVLGNVFIRIPRFWIRKTDGVGYKTWQISLKRLSGGYVPWCFYDHGTGAWLDYVDIGKYPASRAGGGELQSIADVYPVINRNIVDFRTDAEANGAGYQQLDIHVIDMLQTLFYVEFATLNSQAIMNGFVSGRYVAGDVTTVSENGVRRVVVANATAASYRVGQAISCGTSLGGNQRFYGRTITSITDYDVNNKCLNWDVAEATADITAGDIVYNTGWRNGWSGGVAASSGSIVSNADGLHPCMYRGIENPWGNIWQFVDGVNIDGGALWVVGTPYQVGDLVEGTTTTQTYRCIQAHTSHADDRPTTGANWATYWERILGRQAWVCQDASQYASNVFAAPYNRLSYINSDTNNWVTEMGYDPLHPYAEFPAALGGGPNTFYCDYYSQATRHRIARFGGRWSFGSVAGLSYWALNIASSSAGVLLGGRLLKKAL